MGWEGIILLQDKMLMNRGMGSQVSVLWDKALGVYGRKDFGRDTI